MNKYFLYKQSAATVWNVFQIYSSHINIYTFVFFHDTMYKLAEKQSLRNLCVQSEEQWLMLISTSWWISLWASSVTTAAGGCDPFKGPLVLSFSPDHLENSNDRSMMRTFNVNK